MSPRNGSRLPKNQTSLLIGVIVVVILAAAVALAVAQHRKAADLTVKPSTSASPTPTVQGPGKTGSAAAGPGSAGATPTASPTTISNPSHPTGQSLAVPTLIENSATVSLSGATGMESTCQSVPGATCYVQASMGGKIIKVTSAMTIPDSGADGVILNWDAKQLTVGAWTMEAIASLNGQTATSASQILTVSN